MFLCLRRHKISPSTSTVRRDLIFLILNMLFPNLSHDFLTNIDWLLKSHGSIGRFDWFINPTVTLFSNDILLNITLISTAFHWIVSRYITEAGKVEIRQSSFFHIAVICK